MSTDSSKDNIPSTLFISHASKDEKYVKELVSLLMPLHIPNIVCSSLHGYHIPNDVDIYDYLREQISGNGRVVFVLSDNYYQSVACLNEMGACWVLNKNYSTILTPNFAYSEIAGAVNPHQMAFKLNDQDRLCEFVETITEEFETKGLPTMAFAHLVKQTIKTINDIEYDEKVKIENAVGIIEGCRNNDGKLSIALRIINTTQNRLKVESILFDLMDNSKNTFKRKETVDLTLHKEENKIIHFELDYGESSYNFFDSPLLEKVELRTYFDVF
ncbi:toll/interleukin-1 receptor domain-containing protein [Paenibacillus sp. FSL H8-0079]|uniref:toll/interleukin-1 receptor domain-containing protein n=1 Tax=Paenibacillus sp. FSL H8-0079 TaxID=2921375 RepID=UPI0030EC80B9